MKLKSKKPRKKVLDTISLADELGHDYFSARERASTASKMQKEIGDRIKLIAEEVGEREGDKSLVTGNQYVIGVLTTKAEMRVNWEAFKKLHKDLYLKLLSPAVDEKKVEQAVASGLLPRKLLLKYLVPKGEPQKRLVCSKIGHGETNEAQIQGE